MSTAVVPGDGGSGGGAKGGVDKGVLSILLLEVVILVLYLALADYGFAGAAGAQDRVNKYYPLYQDVHVMIFIGFGFLMTFLKKYGFSSIGFNFLLAAFTIQWSILIGSFIHNGFAGHSGPISIDITTLIGGDFAAGAVLISMGACLGKLSAVQLIWMAVFECVFYFINESIGVGLLGAVDMGGSMFVHTFGAYFGLFASKFASPAAAKDHKLNGSSYTSDMFAMVGTVFLWMFWPSFNGALAPGTSQERVIVNTVFSLTASCISTFAFSKLINKEFSMVDVQNATLAGGVAIGSSTDMVVGPGGALFVGFLAGLISTWGYWKASAWLESKLGITDTCGVHNLHGMPGILGGLGGCISAAVVDVTAYDDIGGIFPNFVGNDAYTTGDQAGVQIGALAITLCFAIGGGSITGLVVKRFFAPAQDNLFSDAAAWVVPDDF